MSSRQEILNRVRAAIGPRDEQTARLTVEDRMALRKHNLIPRQGLTAGDERLALFCQKLVANVISCAQVSDNDQVPAAVADYLRSRNLSLGGIILAPHPMLDAIAWEREPHLDLIHDQATAQTQVAVTRADLGIAETGTLVFAAAPENPTSLHFVPEVEITILSAAHIVSNLEASFEYLRARGQSTLPRAVNFVTGPSRTADIELTLTMGAHGPKAVHVIIVG